jgi:hypothetical protein
MYVGVGLYALYMVAFFMFRNDFLREEFYHVTRQQVRPS